MKIQYCIWLLLASVVLQPSTTYARGVDTLYYYTGTNTLPYCIPKDYKLLSPTSLKCRQDTTINQMLIVVDTAVNETETINFQHKQNTKKQYSIVAKRLQPSVINHAELDSIFILLNTTDTITFTVQVFGNYHFPDSQFVQQIILDGFDTIQRRGLQLWACKQESVKVDNIQHSIFWKNPITHQLSLLYTNSLNISRYVPKVIFDRTDEGVTQYMTSADDGNDVVAKYVIKGIKLNDKNKILTKEKLQKVMKVDVKIIRQNIPTFKAIINKTSVVNGEIFVEINITGNSVLKPGAVQGLCTIMYTAICKDETLKIPPIKAQSYLPIDL